MLLEVPYEFLQDFPGKFVKSSSWIFPGVDREFLLFIQFLPEFLGRTSRSSTRRSWVFLKKLLKNSFNSFSGVFLELLRNSSWNSTFLANFPWSSSDILPSITGKFLQWFLGNSHRIFLEIPLGVSMKFPQEFLRNLQEDTSIRPPGISPGVSQIFTQLSHKEPSRVLR